MFAKDTMSTVNRRDRASAAGDSESAIEAVAFLARSEHRVRVLELLSDGAKRRAALKEETDVTRVTLSRILGDLQEQGWVACDDAANRYSLTAFGRHVYEDFARLLGTVSVGREYADVLDRLPTELGFEMRFLATSEFVAGDSADPLAPVRVVADAVRDAETVRVVVGSFTSLPMHTHSEALRAGSAPDVEVVYGSEAAAVVLEDPTIESRWREIEAEADSTVCYSTDETVPCNVDLIDGEEVYLSIGREQGSGFDVIRCTGSEAIDWARELFERKRERAEPLEQRRAERES